MAIINKDNFTVQYEVKITNNVYFNIESDEKIFYEHDGVIFKIKSKNPEQQISKSVNLVFSAECTDSEKPKEKFINDFCGTVQFYLLKKGCSYISENSYIFDINSRKSECCFGLKSEINTRSIHTFDLQTIYDLNKEEYTQVIKILKTAEAAELKEISFLLYVVALEVMAIGEKCDKHIRKYKKSKTIQTFIQNLFPNEEVEFNEKKISYKLFVKKCYDIRSDYVHEAKYNANMETYFDELRKIIYGAFESCLIGSHKESYKEKQG